MGPKPLDEATRKRLATIMISPAASAEMKAAAQAAISAELRADGERALLGRFAARGAGALGGAAGIAAGVMQPSGIAQEQVPQMQGPREAMGPPAPAAPAVLPRPSQMGGPARRFVPRGTAARGNTGVGETPEQLDQMLMQRWQQSPAGQETVTEGAPSVRAYRRMVPSQRPPQDTVEDRLLEREQLKAPGTYRRIGQ